MLSISQNNTSQSPNFGASMKFKTNVLKKLSTFLEKADTSSIDNKFLNSNKQVDTAKFSRHVRNMFKDEFNDDKFVVQTFKNVKSKPQMKIVEVDEAGKAIKGSEVRFNPLNYLEDSKRNLTDAVQKHREGVSYNA